MNLMGQGDFQFVDNPIGNDFAQLGFPSTGGGADFGLAPSQGSGSDFSLGSAGNNSWLSGLSSSYGQGTAATSSSSGAAGSLFGGLPSLSSVFGGMANGPGGATGTGGPSWLAGLETKIQGWGVQAAVVILGIVFVAAGLVILGRGTTVGAFAGGVVGGARAELRGR